MAPGICAAHHPAVHSPRGEFQVGDEILCLTNDRRIGVLNGTLATIDTIADDHLLITTTHGDEVLLPASYWQGGGIAHAYATTVHKAQGRTVDSTHLLLTDDAYREMTYVMLSRHCHHLTIHTASAPADDHHPTAVDDTNTHDPLPAAIERGPQNTSPTTSPHLCERGIPQAGRPAARTEG